MLRRTALFAAALAVLTACGPQTAKPPPASVLTVAATAVPHAEILEVVKPILAGHGVTLEVKVFNDYVQPNLQLDQRQVDVNFFQTKPYLDQFNAERGTHLVTVTGVHVEPLGAYSRRYKTLAALPQGAVVAIPNEPSNGGRALLLLQKAGLIGLKNSTDPLSAVGDVVSNPKGLKFKELEAPALPRVLDQLDLALINTNYALDAELNPLTDALAIEDKSSPYVNYLVARADNKDDPKVRKLAAALTSPQVKAFIEKTYAGAVIPAF